MWLIGLLLFKTRGNSSSSGVNSALVLLVFLGRRRHIIKAPGQQTDFSEIHITPIGPFERMESGWVGNLRCPRFTE